MSKSPIDLDSLDAMAADTVTEYRNLVRAVASGGEIPDQKALLQTLVLAGKSLADFKTDAETLRARFGAVEQIRQADVMQADIQAAVLACEKATANLEEAHTKAKRILDEASAGFIACRQTATDLRNRQLDLRSQASATLERTADPKLAAKIRQLSRHVAQDRTRAVHVDTQYQAQVKTANLAKEGGAKGVETPKPPDPQFARRIAEADRELAQLRQQQVDPFEGNAWTTRMAKAEASTA